VLFEEGVANENPPPPPPLVLGVEKGLEPKEKAISRLALAIAVNLFARVMNLRINQPLNM
jgi:hypothetical protein